MEERSPDVRLLPACDPSPGDLKGSSSGLAHTRRLVTAAEAGSGGDAVTDLPDRICPSARVSLVLQYDTEGETVLELRECGTCFVPTGRPRHCRNLHP